jgi:hypothetical protein
MARKIFSRRTSSGIPLVALLCQLWLWSVAGFQQHSPVRVHPLLSTSTNTWALYHSGRDDRLHAEFLQHSDNPSCRSPLFRSSHENQNHVSLPVWRSVLLAAAVTLGTAASTALPAQALLDISPGTTVLETAPELTPRKFVETTVGTALKAAQTVSSNEKDLLASLKRLQVAASTEVSSTRAWQELWSLLQSYGGDLERQITIRPPADVKRALQDLVQEGKVNFIVNGEVVQVSLEYRSGQDTAATASVTAEGESPETTAIVPDEEWVLKIEGYCGIDPAAIDVALQTPKYDAGTPLWAQNFFEYCRTPYPTKYLSDFLIPSKEGQRPVTYGDILILEGTLAVGFLYAWSYAFYLDEIEQAENAATAKKTKGPVKKTAVKQEAKPSPKKNKKAAPAKEASTTRVTPPPSADASATAVATAVVEESVVAVQKKDKAKDAKTLDEINEEAEDVKVSIDFDSKGQMVITATENKSRDGVFAFVQALYFPWLGMLVPSFTAPETVVISSSEEKETEGLFPFLRALYVPWLGIFQGK